MSARKILILNGHPAANTFTGALCGSYASAAGGAGHDVRMHNLSQLEFDADFGQAGFSGAKKLEPQIEVVLSDFEWAGHVVIAFPLWWGGLPGKLKGLFDRILLPGRTFDPRIVTDGLPKPLLTGKSGRVLIASDTPPDLMAQYYDNAAHVQVERQILNFVGIDPVETCHFGALQGSSSEERKAWLRTAAELGALGA
ncbi:NAD(P)H-dependent oxidoreductase [Leisingera sp. ANG-S5]|uniref:NAD(P)H-dependent oxidoreductase n=1 Tax=Leisingera sp. ANG-S5 TaxID=1577901 RepID=UPI00057D5D37|nr:NAD(P)H-dependent oxidoreductase [Leisingera sp. ANG-S5]KIC32719.1 NAD(P)H dehydrogenase [Leisingera sp. ANG-S5]